jgi:hypothetical protein
MATPIRIEDEVYQMVKDYADWAGRSVANAANYLLRQSTQLEKKMAGAKVEVDDGKIVVTKEYTPEKNIVEATPNIDDLLAEPSKKQLIAERQNAGELNCCLNETRPCKHWVWDTATGEGYRNSLSGRFREAE